MRRLWSQVLAALVMSVLVSVIVAFAVFRASHGGADDRAEAFSDIVLSTGLAHLHQKLKAAPDQQAQMLEEWHEQYGLEYSVVPLDRSLGTEPQGQLTRNQLVFYLPLESTMVEVGPYSPRTPQASWGLLILLTFIVSAAVGATAITVPLARRLTAIDSAIHSMEAGDLSVRVADNTSDMLGRITTGFNNMADALERRVREREELLQAVAHEVSTPLARMQVHLELLAKRLGPEHERRIQSLRNEIGNLDQLNEELVDWVRLDAPAAPHDAIDVAQLVESLVDATVTPGPTVTCNRDAQRTWGSGHPVDIQRAVSNVIRNARRYATSAVRVDVRRDAGDVIIEVHDDGPGIPPDERESVFEPFARREASRNISGGGIGLGLPISRRSLRRNGGTIHIEESPMGGCLVCIRLSVAPPQPILRVAPVVDPQADVTT